jgi:hypothetical protein
MEHYMMIDLEANLDSLLKYQTEDLSKYFVGESSQIAELNQHIRKYKKHYRDFINVYKQRIAKKDAL